MHQQSGYPERDGEVPRFLKETERFLQETERFLKETERFPKETERLPKETERFPKQTERFPKETERFLKETESESEVSQSCPTLCNPMDCSLPGSSLHGILQARVLEWVAIFLLQGIFPTQGLNPGLPHSRQML